MIIECDPLDNTLGGLELTMTAVALGTAASIVVTGIWYAFYLKSSDAEFGDSTSVLWMFCFFLMTFIPFSVATASSVNRNFSDSRKYPATFKVVNKGVSYTKAPQHYLNFMTARGKERVVVTRQFYEEMPVSGTLLFTLRDGFFGYPVITKIERQPDASPLLISATSRESLPSGKLVR